ncbi:MAG: DNA polymerase III subunit beta [Actinomycetota bacterium]|nr:MAG: DNA polymerase III subunit beta [Actinomycetota bacterium]
MKFEIDREVFGRVVASVVGAVPAKSATPILTHLVLDVEDGVLRLTGTDLEISVVRSTREIEKSQDGGFTVPARKLGEVIGVLRGDKIRVSSNDQNRLEIRSGKQEYSLAGTPRDSFPSLPTVPEEFVCALPAARLSTLLSRTTFAAGTDEVRAFLNGANFHVRKKVLRVVATDGHRLAFAEGALLRAPKGDKERSVVVPQKALRELSKILPEEGEVEFVLGGNQVAFRIPDAHLTSRLIAEPFPNYESVIPKKATRTVRVDGPSLEASLQAALPIAETKNGAVVLGFEKNAIRVTAESSEYGSYKDELPAALEGDPIKISFNARYLLDYLRVVPPGELAIELTEESDPAVLRAPKAEGEDEGILSSFYVVMPMRS